MDRPKIKDYFPDNMTTGMINNTFLENKELYNYIQALDNYIDEIESSCVLPDNAILHKKKLPKWAIALNRWLCRFFFLLKLLLVYPLTIFLDFMISKTTDITFSDSRKETIQKIWNEWDKIKSA